jgi:SAM-dependent methyltransferase
MSYICRVCNGNKGTFVLKNMDSDKSGIYSLLGCQNCGFVTIFPFPEKGVLENYYQKSYWENSNKKSFDIRLEPLIKYLRKHFPKKSKVLDWGCGDGMWVRLASKYGFDPLGVDEFSEISDTDGKMIRGNIGSSSLLRKKFDIITSFHVIEHLSDPAGDFEKAFSKLKPGGLMILETPNINSLSFKIFKRKWQPLHIPEHLNFFSPTVLERIVNQAGGVVQKVSFFSFRASPAVIPLSLFPFFEPCKIRRLFKGKYPFQIKLVYLILQVIFLPLTLCEALLRKGAIMRFFVSRKQDI